MLGRDAAQDATPRAQSNQNANPNQSFKETLEYVQSVLLGVAGAEFLFNHPLTAAEVFLLSLYLEKLAVLAFNYLQQPDRANYVSANYSRITLFSNNVTPMLKALSIKAREGFDQWAKSAPPSQNQPVEASFYQRARRRLGL